MAVDISQQTQAIRTAVFAKDVRSSIAGGLDTMASEVNTYEGSLSTDNDQFKADITAEEAQHTQAENARVTAETARANAETTRQANETSRQTVEASRVTAETARETAFAGMQHVDANAELSAARQGKSSLLENLQAKDSQLADIANNLKSPFTHLDGFLGINGGSSGTGAGSSQLSIRNVRGTPSWVEVETTKGIYTWANFDTQHNLAQQYNQKLYITLGNNNTLYGALDNSRAFTDSSTIAAHLNFVDAVSKRYAGFGYMYSFWNEPDVSDVWHYGGNPVAYVSIVKNIYEVIKANDPTSIVSMPDLAGVADWFAKCCELGLLNYTDVVSLHVYESIPENLIQDIHKYRTIIRRYTSVDIPVFITEFGWSSATGITYSGTNVDETTRAKYIVRYILLALYLNIKKIFIYTTRTPRQDATNVQDWFGIYDIDDNWTKLPIANAILTFMDIRYCFIGRESSNKNDYIMKLINISDNTIKYAYWTVGNNHSVKLSTGDIVTLTDTVQVLDTQKKMNYIDILVKEKYDNYSEAVIRTSGFNETFNDIDNNRAEQYYAHAEGYNTLAGNISHSEGTYNVAYPAYVYIISSKDSTNTIITLNNVTNLNVGDTIVAAIGEGLTSEATIITISSNTITLDKAINSSCYYLLKANGGRSSHAGGVSSFATGNVSFAHGYGAISNVYGSMAIGRYNKPLSGDSMNYSATADAFAIGNGSALWATSNAFRVTFDGKTYGLNAFNSTGADYAEYFEWEDNNGNNEDRVGYFVTLDGEKIRKATSQDSYILGIVSATPSVIGDSCQDDWKNKYVIDDWGRIQYKEVQIDAKKDNDGNIITPAHTELLPQINPNWDNIKEYIPREQRPEWSAIGMMGKLLVRDDGTCIINGFCKSNDNGIATKSDVGYKVMKRVSDNIILVLFK